MSVSSKASAELTVPLFHDEADHLLHQLFSRVSRRCRITSRTAPVKDPTPLPPPLLLLPVAPSGAWKEILLLPVAPPGAWKEIT